MDVAQSAMHRRGRVSLSDTDCADGKTVLVCIDGGRLRERRTKRGRKPAGDKRQGYYAEKKMPVKEKIRTTEIQRIVHNSG